MYVRFPLSPRNVEDPLHERGIEVSHETVRFWWRRFGPMFAAEVLKRRVQAMRSSRWRWHVGSVFVKTNGEMHCLRRAAGTRSCHPLRPKADHPLILNTGHPMGAAHPHLPLRIRERAMRRFRRMRSPQKLAAAHASVFNLVNNKRSLHSRPNFQLNRAAALAGWRQLCSAQIPRMPAN